MKKLRERKINKMHVLSLSYGKDSLACLGAIEKLGLPLDRIVHCEVMATKDIYADLPPMIEFKQKADKIIKDKYGITVEHITAGVSYEDIFYRMNAKKEHIYGFPCIKGAWCNSKLKVDVLNKTLKGADCIYIGIAIDEPKRLHRLSDNKISPLVLAKLTEKDCFNWCMHNDLLSPIYETSMRGGCWFCHNQSVNQLRLLRKHYPDYWSILLKWDKDSPITFKPSHTLQDFEKRFNLEDEGILIANDSCFKWACLTGNIQMRFL